MEKQIKAREKLEPTNGKFRVIGIDHFEQPGEEAYIVGEYVTREEAEKVRSERKASYPDDSFYVYP